MAKKVNVEYLQNCERLLKEALSGNVPEKHKDGVQAYIKYLKKEILLATRSSG